MKYVLVIGLVLVVLWLWRSNKRAGTSRPAAPAPEPSKQVTEIVACEVCHVHLPRSEALPGPGGMYCSAAHRQQAGN